MNSKLGSKIREIRKRSLFGSQTEAAQTMGVSTNTFSSYERGETLPDIDFIARFAAHTDSDLSELLNLRIAAAQPELQIAVGAGGFSEPGAPYIVADDSALWTEVAGELYELVSSRALELTGKQFAGALKIGTRLKNADPDADLAGMLRDILDTF